MKNKKHIDKTEHKNNENSIEQLEKNKYHGFKREANT